MLDGWEIIRTDPIYQSIALVSDAGVASNKRQKTRLSDLSASALEYSIVDLNMEVCMPEIPYKIIKENGHSANTKFLYRICGLFIIMLLLLGMLSPSSVPAAERQDNESASTDNKPRQNQENKQGKFKIKVEV
jgi:hypothetical protein